MAEQAEMSGLKVKLLLGLKKAQALKRIDIQSQKLELDLRSAITKILPPASVTGFLTNAS